MPTYIALLRGINVGGNKIIKMQDLKDMFQSLGYENIRTYIQSGNVIFEHGGVRQEVLIHDIEQGIRDTFGFEVPVILRTQEELEQTLASNPFEPLEPEAYKQLYVSFLLAEPSVEAIDKLRPYGEGQDRISFVGREMYTLYGISASQSELFKVPVDKWLGMPLTARNWNTVNKLVALCKKL